MGSMGKAMRGLAGILGVTAFCFVTAAQIEDSKESANLEDLGDGVQQPTVYVAADGTLFQNDTTVQDTMTATEASAEDGSMASECIMSTYDQVKRTCNLKGTKRECDGPFRDWFCNHHLRHNCGPKSETDKNFLCEEYVVGGVDNDHTANCCTWNQAYADKVDVGDDPSNPDPDGYVSPFELAAALPGE